MQAVRRYWKLSPEYPFSLKRITERKPVYPSADMHEALHLVMILEGKDVYCRIGDSEFCFQPGDLWLSAPWEPHTSCSKDFCTFWLFTFDSRAMARLFPHERSRFEQMLYTPPQFRMELLNKMDESAFDPGRWQSRGAQWFGFCGFFAEWIELCSEEQLPRSFWNDRLAPALDALRSGRPMPLSISDAAAQCSLSVCRFSQLFKASFGLSFGAYELHYRLQQAADALRQSDLQCKEIAEKYGFCDKSHFSKMFRRVFGLSPAEFRSRNAEDGSIYGFSLPVGKKQS